MKIEQEGSGNVILEFSSQEVETLAKQIIQHAENAHSSVLNLAYLINEAKFDSRNNFRQPDHPWDPLSRQRGSINTALFRKG